MAADVSIIVETNAKEVGSEFTGMAGQIIGAAEKAKKLAQAFDFLDTAMNGGKIDAQQYSKAVQILDKTQDALYSSIGKTNTAVKAQSAAMDNAAVATTRASGAMSQAAIRAQNLSKAQRLAGKSTNKFGMISQQVGYQVGDFFVQVQSGTDALVAFGQQGTQLAGLLPGLGGAILGIGLSLGTALLNASLRAKELRVDFKAVAEDLGNALEPISPLIDAIGNALGYMGQIASQVLQSLLNNLDRVVAYFTVFVTLISIKLVAGFIASGAAAKFFFETLKRGLISTGIGAIVVILGEILLAMTKLVKSAGGVGEAFKLLYDVAKEAFGNLPDIIDLVPLAWGAAMDQMKFLLTQALRDMLFSFQDFTNKMVTALNDTFNMSLPTIQIAGLGSMSSPLDRAVADAEVAAQKSAGALKTATDALMENSPKLQELFDRLSGGDGAGIDTSDWLVSDSDTKGGSKGAKDSMKTFMELLDALNKENSNQKELLGVYGSKREAIEQIISFEKELQRELTATEILKVEQAAKERYRIEQQAKILDSVVGNVATFIDSFVDGTKSIEDAFKSMLRNILMEVWRQSVTQPISEGVGSFIRDLFFANGGAFQGGSQIKAYADGGVVGGPTMFPMSGGKTGLMGEAGPEAIMPLKRGRNGKLGVQMEGSGPSNVVVNNHFHIAANGDESVRRIVAAEAPRIANLTQKQIMDQRRRGGNMKTTFG
jgi:hypothetical protein